jgi:hypothetical protein
MPDFFETALHGRLLALGGVLLLALFLADEAGFRLGRRRSRRNPSERDATGVGLITTGMLGLLAFTLGLTISMAQGRFDARRMLVVEEANAIGTAWLRAGLVEAPEGPAIQALLQDYTRLRLDYTTHAGGQGGDARLNAETSAAQARIWQQMQTLGRRAPTPITASLAAALNQVFDMSVAQRFAYESRVPLAILWMLLGGSVLSIGAVGFQFGLGGHRLPVMSTLLILMWVGGMLLIVDLSRPRTGTIRPDPKPLIWTLEGFGEATPQPLR